MSIIANLARAGRYRWLICSLLFLATTVNYIDRQILALLKPMLDEYLHWTNAEFGLVNSAFQAVYAVGFLLFGAFVDRFGARIGYGISIAAWSLAAMGHALVSSVFGFGLARAALGLGEAGAFPSSIKAVTLWFPKRERAFATALFNSGANVGAILAPAFVPFMASAWGWRAPFVFMGLVGFLWLFLWIPFYNDPHKIPRLSPEELEHIRSENVASESTQRMPWRKVMRYPQAWSFIVAKFITDPVWWFFLIWLPDYFKKTRGLDIKKSWVHLVTIYAIITVLSIAGGWLTTYLVRRGLAANRARKTAMFIFACTVLPIFFVTRTSPWIAVVLIGIAGASHQAWMANLFTTVSDMFPKSAVASVVGLGGTAGSVGGIIFPFAAGWLLDRFQAQGNVTMGYTILFGICGCAYLVAFAANHLLAPKFEQVKIAGEGA